MNTKMKIQEKFVTRLCTSQQIGLHGVKLTYVIDQPIQNANGCIKSSLLQKKENARPFYVESIREKSFRAKQISRPKWIRQKNSMGKEN
ncbi:hypothetical protein CW304_21920 [Bacillus sp. UFRGS-B20]|nr:hypothetical protein CW304_21920 [Bacillus sp. UFRGS-B20]